MQHWRLDDVPTPQGSRSPVVLHSREGESRVVLIGLDPGQALGDHQVKEAALLLVVGGDLRVEARGESVDAAPGDLFRFEPDERHSIVTDGGATVLLMLAPWPGEGHYRGDQPAEVSAS